jgi:hypothetical protein
MSKVVTKAARQGDVLVLAQGLIPRLDVDISKLQPADLENGRLILAHGEATGHHHSFPSRQGAILFRDMSNAPLAFKIEDAMPLEHQEHSTIIFAPSKKNPEGKFNNIRQRVFQSGMARRVVD